LFSLLGALKVSKVLGRLEFFAQFGEPASICGFGLFVQHLASVARATDMNPGLFQLFFSPGYASRTLGHFGFILLACNPSQQVQNVKLCVWMAQQMSDVPESPRFS
jgi:hypothetical protein